MNVPAEPTPTLRIDDPVLSEFAEAVGSEGPVAIEGARTRWAVGGPLDDGARVLSAPAGIVQYQPEEMTVRVRAGTPVRELHAVLADKGQRTALPERGGTVGGALAVGESDHRALGRGLTRTALLQIRYVSAEGRLISSGGPTVKNVSGFDIPRLMVGSLGTLGLLAEAILRTNPIPAVSQWVRVDGARPGECFDQLLAPSCVLWDGNSIWVELEGHGSDVAAQRALLGKLGDVVDAEPPPLPANRWSLSPAEALQLDPGSAHQTGAFIATVGLGLVFAELPQPQRPLTPDVEVVTRRMKDNFDPTGRLNPGRTPGRR